MPKDLFSKAWMKTEARQHWKRHLPRLYSRLKNSGKLEAALDEAATKTRGAMEALEQKAGMKPDEAWPEVRGEWIVLDPATYER